MVVKAGETAEAPMLAVAQWENELLALDRRVFSIYACWHKG
jgi:hypothetical protein